jgi:hypothetical protein
VGLPGNFAGEHIAHIKGVGAFNVGIVHSRMQGIVGHVT